MNQDGPPIDLILTEDGSHSLFHKGLNEHYHSIHGALTESRHVFIDHGFRACNQRPLRIFEMGFGTGLNAVLTLQAARTMPGPVEYHALEKAPLSPEIWTQLNHPQLLDRGMDEYFRKMHQQEWNTSMKLNHEFMLHKAVDDLIEFVLPEHINLVYYDAFAPEVQPALWSDGIFRKLYAAMDEGGILVTYVSKSSVRRTMQAAGFRVEKLAGPPGKREISRAWKDRKN